MHLVLQIVGTVFTIFGLLVVIWLAIKGFRNSDNPMGLAIKWIVTVPLTLGCVVLALKMGPYGPFVFVFLAVILSLMWTPHLADIVSSPLTNLFDGGKAELDPKPYYSIAYARRKRGEFSEAIMTVREQLAKFPNDYEGVVLLASIQAEDTKDVPSAEITLNRFCEWQEAPPKQVAAALMLLADWQLKLVHDVDSAKATLQRIIERFPDTELSTAAAQRLAHLGGTNEILAAARDRQKVVVPEGVRSAGLRETLQDIVPKDVAPEKVAADLTNHLAEHPLDAEAREKLAMIYAEHYKRMDMAWDQLAELIAQHGKSPKRVAYWLNLFADLQVRAGADFDTVRPTLEKIIEWYPDLPVASLAQSRLNHLKLEIKGKQAPSADKAMGQYEQNLGIKYGRPWGMS